MDPADALAEILDIIDDEQRAGWSTHAWTTSWYVPTMLLVLGSGRVRSLLRRRVIETPAHTAVPASSAVGGDPGAGHRSRLRSMSPSPVATASSADAKAWAYTRSVMAGLACPSRPATVRTSCPWPIATVADQ